MELSTVLNVAIIFFCCYKVIEVLVHRKERIIMAQQVSSAHENNVDLSKVFGNCDKNNSNWPLRIGSMLVGLGLGIIIAYAIVAGTGLYDMVSSESGHYIKDQISTIYSASALLFGGLGLVFAYIFERKNKDK